MVKHGSKTCFNDSSSKPLPLSLNEIFTAPSITWVLIVNSPEEGCVACAALFMMLVNTCACWLGDALYHRDVRRQVLLNQRLLNVEITKKDKHNEN